MSEARDIDRLRGLADRICSIIADGRTKVRLKEASDWKALALIRFNLLHALEEFNLFKMSSVLAPLMLQGDHDLREAAARIINSNRKLQDAYEDFVQDWSLKGPVMLVDQYAVEATSMASLIEQHIKADVARIEALVEVAPTQRPNNGEARLSS